MSEPIFIRNETDLYRALERALDAEDIDASNIVFEGYPKYEITIRGADFQGGVPTRILPSLLKFQRNLRDTYSQIKYGEIRKLSKEETQKTELVIYVDDRKSSYFWADKADEILNNALQYAIKNMTGDQIVITVLGLAALWAGTNFYRIYLDQKIKGKVIDKGIRLSEEETKRQDLLVQALNQSGRLAVEYDKMSAVNNQVAKSLDQDDVIVFEDDTTIGRDTIRQAIRKPREPAVETRLDGNFKILSVDSGNVRNGFKIKVQQVDGDHKMLVVAVPAGTLSEGQINTLQDGEWQKEILHMEINANQSGDRIYKCTLVKAGLRKSN